MDALGKGRELSPFPISWSRLVSMYAKLGGVVFAINAPVKLATSATGHQRRSAGAN